MMESSSLAPLRWLQLLMLMMVLRNNNGVAAKLTLVACMDAMVNFNIDGDYSLNYAEYLNMLVALSMDSPCPISANEVLRDVATFRSDFERLACKCQNYTASVAEVPPCVCNLAGAAPTATDGLAASLAVPGIYPGAYVVSICDDITGKLLLAQCDTGTQPPTGTPVAMIVATGTQTPTRFSVKVPPLLEPSISPSPAVVVVVKPVDELPTAAPVLEIVPVTGAAPSSGLTENENDGQTTRVSTEPADDDKHPNTVAIVVPILTLVAVSVIGILWTRKREKQHEQAQRGIPLHDEDTADVFVSQLVSPKQPKQQPALDETEFTETEDAAAAMEEGDEDNYEEKEAEPSLSHLNLVLPNGGGGGGDSDTQQDLDVITVPEQSPQRREQSTQMEDVELSLSNTRSVDSRSIIMQTLDALVENEQYGSSGSLPESLEVVLVPLNDDSLHSPAKSACSSSNSSVNFFDDNASSSSETGADVAGLIKVSSIEALHLADDSDGSLSGECSEWDWKEQQQQQTPDAAAAAIPQTRENTPCCDENDEASTKRGADDVFLLANSAMPAISGKSEENAAKVVRELGGLFL